MKKISTIAVAALLIVQAFQGCSHAPRAPQDPAVAVSLSDRLKRTLVQELESRHDLKKIKSVDIYQVESDQSDIYRLSYRVSFESDSQPLGEVSHDFDGIAVIVKQPESDRPESDWKVERLERKSQSLNFHQPATVLTEKKKSSQQQ